MTHACLLRCLVRESRIPRRTSLGHAAQDGVRKPDGALADGAPHQRDRLVHRRRGGHAAREQQLEDAQAQGVGERPLEAVDAAARKRLQRLVERALALHGAVGQVHREPALARVEAMRAASAARARSV